ncbi:MAG TPA: hypothetical protein PKY30_05080 [Myxococcota bacterium]|nr:hypothetical protein [Myxococcota bacterium]
MRVVAIVALVAVGLGAAWWWQAGRGAEAPGLLPAAGGSRPTVDPSFQAFPKDYQPEQVQRALEGLPSWADSQYSGLQIEILGVDCSQAPCLVGMRFRVGDDPAQVWRVQAAAKAEVERRLGYSLGTVHLDEDPEKRQYLWMYGLPEEILLDPALGPQQSAAAEDRYALKMLGLKPAIEPPLVQAGEDPR